MLKSLRLINAGFLLGLAFCIWLFSDEIDESARKRKEQRSTNEKFNEIYQHYKEKLDA
jgi:hypothetical protein